MLYKALPNVSYIYIDFIAGLPGADSASIQGLLWLMPGTHTHTHTATGWAEGQTAALMGLPEPGTVRSKSYEFLASTPTLEDLSRLEVLSVQVGVRGVPSKPEMT